MSTIPFTPIEGSLALPRLRPLAELPMPFGRDWSLLPPGYSMRAELRALYAAMLRTFCLSDQAMRALCDWVPLASKRENRQEEMAAAALPLPPRPLAAPVFDTVRVERKPEATKGTSAWVGVAGGVCALSGAALLAWIAAGHFGQHQAEQTHASVPDSGPATPVAVAQPTVARNAASAEPSATSNRAAPDFSVAAPHVSPSSGVSAPAPSDALLSLAQPGPVAVQSSNDVAARSAPRVASVRADNARLRDTHNRKTARARLHAAPAAVKPLHRAVAPLDALSHIPSPPHGKARPSTAGAYSPMAPPRLGVDEYAGVSMSAATPAQRIAPPSHTAPSVSASQTGSASEWSNRMSQRRVTDVPDQFSH